MSHTALDLKTIIEVRRYPDLRDADTYEEAHYEIGALGSVGGVIDTLILKRQDGSTEALRIRLLAGAWEGKQCEPLRNRSEPAPIA